MPFIVRVLLGIAIVFVGFLIVWKTETIFKWTGTIAFAEAKLGIGSTRFFIKLIGIAIIFIGIAVMTNLISNLLNSFASLFAPNR